MDVVKECDGGCEVIDLRPRLGVGLLDSLDPPELRLPGDPPLIEMPWVAWVVSEDATVEKNTEDMKTLLARLDDVSKELSAASIVIERRFESRETLDEFIQDFTDLFVRVGLIPYFDWAVCQEDIDNDAEELGDVYYFSIVACKYDYIREALQWTLADPANTTPANIKSTYLYLLLDMPLARISQLLAVNGSIFGASHRQEAMPEAS